MEVFQPCRIKAQLYTLVTLNLCPVPIPVSKRRLTFLLLLLYHLGKKFPRIHHYRGISLCDLGTQFLVCHQDNAFLWKTRFKKMSLELFLIALHRAGWDFFRLCSEGRNFIQCTTRETKESNKIVKLQKWCIYAPLLSFFVERNWAVKWWIIQKKKIKKQRQIKFEEKKQICWS